MNEIIIAITLIVIAIAVFACVLGIIAILKHREKIYVNKIIEFNEHKKRVTKILDETKKDLYGE